MSIGYNFGSVFQLRILSFLVRNPQKAIGVVEPRYFGDPLHKDIAEAACEAYKKHPKDPLEKAILKELLKQKLNRKEMKNWEHYKQIIRSIYGENVDNPEILLEQASSFAKEQRYRATLISAEKFVTAGRYEKIHELFDGLRESANGHMTFNMVPALNPQKVSRTKWLVQDLIPERAISLFFGEFGSFKSTLQQFLAKAVAAGDEVFDLKTRQRKVLYLDYENPADVIRQRNEDLELRLEENQMLKIWDRFGSNPIPKPGDPRLEEIVKSCIRETERGPWIIFDSWASLLRPGEGGETTGQVAPVYQSLRKLCDLGATVTVLDHSRKYDRETIYGGGDKEAKADVIHNLVVHENKVKPQNPIVKIQSFLKRQAPKGYGSFAFQVISKQDKDGKWHVKGLILAKDPEVEARRANIHLLKDLIRENPTVGQRNLEQLASAKGLPMNQAGDLLKGGIGKHWETTVMSHGKTTYKVLD